MTRPPTHYAFGWLRRRSMRDILDALEGQQFYKTCGSTFERRNPRTGRVTMRATIVWRFFRGYGLKIETLV